jgi:hypothetical protein
LGIIKDPALPPPQQEAANVIEELSNNTEETIALRDSAFLEKDWDIFIYLSAMSFIIMLSAFLNVA